MPTMKLRKRINVDKNPPAEPANSEENKSKKSEDRSAPIITNDSIGGSDNTKSITSDRQRKTRNEDVKAVKQCKAKHGTSSPDHPPQKSASATSVKERKTPRKDSGENKSEKSEGTNNETIITNDSISGRDNSRPIKSDREKKIPEQTSNEDMKAVEEFKAKHGHINVPPPSCLYPSRKEASATSGRETKTPRKYSGENKSKKSEHRSEPIITNDSISGSDNNKPITSGRQRKAAQQAWDEKLDALKKFKVEHGHTNVPKNEKCKQIGRWVNNQRQFYRKRVEGETSSLTEDRIKSLEELGFVWSMKKPVSEGRAKILQAQWEQRLQELQEYKQVHGDCNVPLKGKDRELSKFVMNQRYYYKTILQGEKNSLTPKRIQDLENIGFVWTLKGRREGDKFLSNEEKWERNIEGKFTSPVPYYSK